MAARGAEAPFCCRASRIPSAHTWELSSVRAFIAFAVSFTASCRRQAMVLRRPGSPACCVHGGTHVVSAGRLKTYTGGAPREHDDADDERQQDAGTDAQNPCHHDEKTTYTRQVWVALGVTSRLLKLVDVMVHLTDGGASAQVILMPTAWSGGAA